MASNPPGNCCAKGFRHAGEGLGKIVDINGIETYIVGDESSKKILIYLTDVLGHKFVNHQILASNFARAGYFVVVPDLFDNDAVSLNPPEGFDLFGGWFPKHPPEVVRPIVEKVVKGVADKYAPTYVATVGYCFGAKYSIQLIGEGKANAAAVFHPSFVTIDEIKAIKAPLLIGAAETDPAYTVELRKETEAALKEIKATYFTTLASGVAHGFADRGDISIPVVKFAKEKAFRDAVEWFNDFAI